MTLPLQIAVPPSRESGNVLFIILIAVVLIGALTAAIQSSNRSEGSNIDGETLVIRVTEVQRYASELERAVNFIMEGGKSEVDLRFAHPNANSDYGDLSADADPSDQIFSPTGGAAAYRDPPNDVNDGSAWEFYGNTHIPAMGTPSRAELIAVLPNVSQAFCDQINRINGQSAAPADTATCLNTGAIERFDDGTQFDPSPNSVDETTFAQDPNTSSARPAPQACVRCTVAGTNHFYHVLLVR